MEELKKELPYCKACGGHHEPDSPNTWVDFRGYRFKPPFLCMCCGKVICARQFAFGRCCGPCDMGACCYGNRAFRKTAVHPPPPWGRHNGEAGFLAFVEYTKATPSPSVTKVSGETALGQEATPEDAIVEVQ